MPYIHAERREALSSLAMELADKIQSSGEANFAITTLLLRFLSSAPNYTDFNNAIGILECVKLEMYRRAVAPYEDTKMLSNGDVY